MTSSTLNLAILQILLTVLVLTVHTSVNGKFDNEVDELRYIGSVEGKSYFVEMTQTRNWNDAKAYCLAAGMRMASVTTAAEFNFLKSHLNTFNSAFWTGALTNAWFSQDRSPFKWDHNGESLHLGVVNFIHEPQRCMLMWIWEHMYSEYWTADCSRDSFYVLCEIKVNKK